MNEINYQEIDGNSTEVDYSEGVFFDRSGCDEKPTDRKPEPYEEFEGNTVDKQRMARAFGVTFQDADEAFKRVADKAKSYQ